MSSIVITGATDGIGLETAKQLLGPSNHLIVHARNEDKARQLIDSLRTVDANAPISPVWGDLSNMAEVCTLAAQIKRLNIPIDCLINNAGVYISDYVLTTDGFELTMAVNYFAAYLLTRLLADELNESTHARIVNVSSMTHSGAKLDIDDLNMKKSWSGYDAYCNSKFANILFSNALASRHCSSELVSNALHPGVVTTKLLQEAFSMSGISTADGAQTSIYLAQHPDTQFLSGKYFVDCAEAVADERTNKRDLINSLWESSETILKPFLG